MTSINNKFNGIDTEVLNSVFRLPMKKQPEAAKATFFVKSEWNGGFSVTSSSKDFRIGAPRT